MNSRKMIDRSVIQAQIESEQQQFEGIIYSVAIHILFFMLALNFKTIEKHFDLNSSLKKKKPVAFEITLIELESAASTANAASGASMNIESNVSMAPDLQKLDSQTTIDASEIKTEVQTLSQPNASPIKQATVAKGEVNQLTKESREAASVSQAEIQMNLLRERQRQMQREIDEARVARERQLMAEQVAREGISNLVDEESGLALVSPEKFEKFMESESPEIGLSSSGSEFVVNINQISVDAGQEPCDPSKQYHNPANECRPYKQTLYKPLCFYEYDECLVLMRKYKIKTGQINPEE